MAIFTICLQDYLDVMELRLGGTYLNEMKDLRGQK